MTNGFGTMLRSIVDWVSASDYRYREACKMMALDDEMLEDIGITRDELLAELGIRRVHGTKHTTPQHRWSGAWNWSARRRMARGSL